MNIINYIKKECNKRKIIYVKMSDDKMNASICEAYQKHQGEYCEYVKYNTLIANVDFVIDYKKNALMLVDYHFNREGLEEANRSIMSYLLEEAMKDFRNKVNKRKDNYRAIS